MFIILIQGGLGNQMFGYAFYLALKQKYPKSLFLFKISGHVNEHHGLEIFNIFSLKGKWRYILCKPSFFWRYFHQIKQGDALEYKEQLLDTSFRLNYFEGHWQSEKYFKHIENIIRKGFKFNTSQLSKETLRLSTKIINTNSVSIHIRRGDYLNFEQCATCGTEYYQQAINYFTRIKEVILFFVFSDDIQWCKTNLLIPNVTFVDFNHGKESWQDMYLMSVCKHNIIANSTFSWWGAWLNSNLEKIVIAPKLWFLNSENKDIIPDKWIIL